MAGYCGYSKSNNAVEAEENGIFPLSHVGKHIQYLIVKNLGFKPTLKDCKVLAEAYGASEWHHSSKFYNRVDYYDSQAIFDDLVETFTKDEVVNTRLQDFIDKNVDIINYPRTRAEDTSFAQNYIVRKRDIENRRGELHKELKVKVVNKFLKENVSIKYDNSYEKPRRMYFVNDKKYFFNELVVFVMRKCKIDYHTSDRLTRKYFN